MVFLRFTSTNRHPQSDFNAGVFWAAHRLQERSDLSEETQNQLAAILKRLEDAIPKPSRFTRTQNASHKRTRGLSWIKSSATELVSDLHRLAGLLRQNDVPVEVLKTSHPGYIVYEDSIQVVAEPFTGA
jgi:hypothetical protein